MNVEISEEPISRLVEYGSVPIAFTVDRVLAVSAVDDGLGGVLFTETTLAEPYVKDYDAIAGEGPSSWPRRFDTSRWGLLAARDESGRIGGAVVVPRSRRPGGASLFDLRVHPAARSRGVGSALFGAAEAWASSRGCSVLDVETQNVNVAACRFYAAMGCALSSLDRHAYPALPDEVQLVWSKSLERPTTT